MIDYAIVGTGPVSVQFAEAAGAHGGWRLRGVHGTTQDRGSAFLRQLASAPDGSTVYGDLRELAGSKEVDVVYVATPNSLHLPVVERALACGKHVIVEKPAFSNATEWRRAHDLADRCGVLLLEAARHLYEDNYQRVRAAVAGLGTVTGASLAWRQYSSRYPAHLAGQTPRILSTEYSGGALADLGVYLLYAAVDWFGVPDAAFYHARLLDTGVDVSGIALLHYPGFDVQLTVSKNQRSAQHDEVYGERGRALAFNSVAGVSWAAQTTAVGRPASGLAGLTPPTSNPLTHEVAHFARRLGAFPAEPGDAPYTYGQLRELGSAVAELSERLRASAGVVFTADHAGVPQ